ncbi:hypothetical protein EK904_006195 [Melospiza melodia maxima]|nr:hypothetical protein EK904_006195 [Melospiza melodia maxima]
MGKDSWLKTPTELTLQYRELQMENLAFPSTSTLFYRVLSTRSLPQLQTLQTTLWRPHPPRETGGQARLLFYTAVPCTGVSVPPLQGNGTTGTTDACADVPLVPCPIAPIPAFEQITGTQSLDSRQYLILMGTLPSEESIHVRETKSLLSFRRDNSIVRNIQES